MGIGWFGSQWNNTVHSGWIKSTVLMPLMLCDSLKAQKHSNSQYLIAYKYWYIHERFFKGNIDKNQNRLLEFCLPDVMVVFFFFSFIPWGLWVKLIFPEDYLWRLYAYPQASLWTCLFLAYTSLRNVALEDELGCGLCGIHGQREIIALRLVLEGSINTGLWTHTQNWDKNANMTVQNQAVHQW